MKLPGVLVQTVFVSQLSVPVVHSLISGATESMCSRTSDSLTRTVDSISTVALVTGTSEATRGVGTDSISVTVISTSGTLINIWSN